MAPQTRPIEFPASVILDASGNGRVTFGPQTARSKWRITSVAVQIPGNNTNIPTASVYRGQVQPANFVTGTYNGNNDSDNAVDILLFTGQIITVEWLGGDVGKQATATIRGEQVIGS